MQRIAKLFFFLTFLGLAPSCAPFAIVGALKNQEMMIWIEKLTIELSEETVLKKPLSVHLVIAYDEGLRERLAKMTSEKYFAQQKRLEKDYADVAQFFKYEINPGHQRTEYPVKLQDVNAVAGFIFVNYKTPGAHRESIAVDKVVEVVLDKDEFSIAAVKEEEPCFKRDFLNLFN